MWRMNCGCNPPVENGSIVIKIEKREPSYRGIKLPNSTDKTEELKCEIIQDFLDVVDNLECGIQPDLQELLEELSILEIMNPGNFNVTKKIYASNKEEGDDILRKSKYFSDFNTEEDRRKALQNLGIDSVKHIVLSREEYENMEYFDKNAIYFITQ